MGSLLRAGVLTLVASLGVGVVGAPVAAQEASALDAALKSRVERRFRVLPVRDGLVLTPRRDVQRAAVDRDPRRRDCRRRHADVGRAVARTAGRRHRPGVAGLLSVGRRAGHLERAEAPARTGRRRRPLMPRPTTGAEASPPTERTALEHPLAQELREGPHRQQHRRRRRRAGHRPGRRRGRQRHRARPRGRRRGGGGRKRAPGSEGARARRRHRRRGQRRTGEGRLDRRHRQRSAHRAAVQLQALALLRRHVVRRLECRRRRLPSARHRHARQPRGAAGAAGGVDRRAPGPAHLRSRRSRSVAQRVHGPAGATAVHPGARVDGRRARRLDHRHSAVAAGALRHRRLPHRDADRVCRRGTAGGAVGRGRRAAGLRRAGGRRRFW